ncbi:MAG: CbiX/SirB N-terminal domain-containing protein [Lentisphaerales bacterium]|nr:CbiX/SirB N-terminal domain-containing protein [Lentisphaerales bacterium]
MEHSQRSKLEKAVILIAHGSRLQKTADEMKEMVEKLQLTMPESLIKPAFMELQQPNLKSAMNEVLEEGIKKINIVPLFFFTGRHMRDDIPAQVNECRNDYPDCEIVLQPCFGHTEQFIDALRSSVSTL